MTRLRANLPPAITFTICLCTFGYLTWVYPSPFPDMGLMISTIFCINWAQARNELVRS